VAIIERFVGDVFTELILKHARTINSSAPLLFKAQLSPWAKGGRGPQGAADDDEEEELDTTPKKLEWNMTPELRMGVRFAETRLSDLICQNEVVSLEFSGYGKNFITSECFFREECSRFHPAEPSGVRT
jgi:carnitine O-acetyltransferase